MTKLSNRILEDLTSTLVNLSGNLKDIECGTHIKIPTGAGYVSYYKSSDNSEKLQLWLTQLLTPEKNNDEYQQYLNDLATVNDELNITKSD